MKQIDKGIGFEFICRAANCTFNDCPACTAHTERSPVIIGLQGRCIRYAKKKDVVWSSDDEMS